MISPQDPPSDACEMLTISANNFTEHASFAKSVKGIICAAEHYQLLTVTDVPPGWEDFLWEADEDLPVNRKTYDPITGLLRVSIMPTNGHDVAIGWLSRAMVRWTRAGLTTPQEEDILYTISNANIDFKSGPYRGWRKQPDAAFRIEGLTFPTLIVEVGWSEGYPDLLDDMNKLLVGGNGDIRAVIIIKLIQHGVNVSGFLEVYRLNSQGIPYLAQDETVFPEPQGQAASQQQVRVTRSELFGKFLVPGMTGADILPLDVDWLRSICRPQIALMGLEVDGSLSELSKPARTKVVAASKEDAKVLHSKYSSIGINELAVEVAMVRLAVGMAKHIRGLVHVQTNPYYSYSSEKTIINALRIVQLFQHVEPGFDVARIAIKIPSTWEGMMACRTLELAGVRTLATTLFSMPQAILAAEVGCTYVAPYVNELKVQVNAGIEDDQKLLPLCVAIQQYYKSVQALTKVLPASLTSTEEIFMLAGVDHLTIAPHLLAQLTKPMSTDVKALFNFVALEPVSPAGISYVHDHDQYQITFARDKGGASQRKLTEAVNIFCDFQDNLESMMKAVI